MLDDGRQRLRTAKKIIIEVGGRVLGTGAGRSYQDQQGRGEFTARRAGREVARCSLRYGFQKASDINAQVLAAAPVG